MDLKTWLYERQMPYAKFAKHMGVCRETMYPIIHRSHRPRPYLAAAIQWVTKGKVTIDELMNPENYECHWLDDKVNRTTKVRSPPMHITQEIREKFVQID